MPQVAEALAPVYAAIWPERPLERVTVVCEGPSACEASPDQLFSACLNGPIVAVNRAIAFSDVLPVDAWATMDDPRFLWDWAQAYLHPTTKLFSGDDTPNILLWRDILTDDGLGRLYTRPPTYMDELAEASEDGKAPMLPTLFHTLAWLLQVGAKHVRLVGCDMQGSGSPLGPEWDPFPDEGHVLRWNVERELLAHSTKHYRARGARIERWQMSK